MALPKIVADFSCILASKLQVAGETAVLSTNVDGDGTTLPDGVYYFTLDADLPTKEYITCTKTGVNLSAIKTVTRQGVETAGVLRKHRIGALVELTDFATYKSYMDETALQGATDASTTQKGLVEEATQAEANAGTAEGSTGARLYVSPAAMPQASATVSGVSSIASETALGVVEEATDAEVTAGTATGGSGAKLFITPAKLATRFGSVLKFGGNGADGALAITSGTTTIDLAGAQVVTKNYTSISITGTGVLAFSNPHANGTMVILKSQGDVTLTSSATPMLNASGLGAAGGNGGSKSGTSSGYSNGGAGTTGISLTSAYYTNGGVANNDSTAGGGGALPTYSGLKFNTSALLASKFKDMICGAGGAGGGTWKTSASAPSGSCVGGAGGRGGGVLVIECGGAWDFTTTLGISVAGANGVNGSYVDGNSADLEGAGGGGGGGGLFLGIYNKLTANTGTINVAGGTGGTLANKETGNSVAGSGGGASMLAVGTGGGATNSGINNGQQIGGNGGAGLAVVVANTEFA